MTHPKKASDSAAAAMDQNQSTDFLWKVHGYTNEYIRFADPKAGIALALVSGLIAAMFAAKCHTLCAPAKFGASMGAAFVGSICLIGFILLLISATFFTWGISPRLWAAFRATIMERVFHEHSKPTEKGYIFWDQVLAHGSEDSFVTSVRQLSIEQQSEFIARHIHTLAGIASEKFRWIKWGFRLGYVGAVFAILALLLS